MRGIFCLAAALFLSGCVSSSLTSTPARAGATPPTAQTAVPTRTPTARPTLTLAPTKTPTPVPTPVGQSGDWRLIFSDEFSGTALDDNKWSTCWSYGCATSQPSVWYSATNVIVANGIARLRADNRPQFQHGREIPYTSGMLATGGGPGDRLPRFTVQYGFLEARVRVPAGNGLWPAFWLLSPLQRPPEIDIMEVLSKEPSVVHMHYHYLDAAGVEQDYGAAWRAGDFSQGWHTFGVDWRPDAIVWYVDGVQRNIYQGSYIAAEPLYLILNLQVGGKDSWAGPADKTTVFPAYYDIDYVRVWQSATP